MKSYLNYRSQMQGIAAVAETVKTVEKIAASSVHFLKQEVNGLNSHSAKVEQILARLSLFYRQQNHPLLQTRMRGKKAVVILTGDKGLVGGLWHKVINFCLEHLQHYRALVVIGAKGANYLREEKLPVVKVFAHFLAFPRQQDIARIGDYIFTEFTTATFSQVDILYPQFVSLARQEPKLIPFLPFKLSGRGGEENGTGLPIFEPAKQEIFARLLQKWVRLFFHKVVLEARLAEFSARTVAMEHAAAKTEELVCKLKLAYAKERRRIITQRQLESFAAHQTV